MKWLRVGEEVPHAGAGQGEAEGVLPLQARVAGHHAGHQPQQAHGREYEAGTSGCTATQNSPQSMRVWLRLIGAGGKIPKGVFVAVAEVEPDGVWLKNPLCVGASRLRAAGGLERAARRLHEVAHLEEHAPLPARAGPPQARGPCGARTPRGRVPEEAALQVHLALHVLALGAHLDGALQLALKLGAGGPQKGLLEDDHVVDDALLHLLRPQLQSTRPPSWPRRPGSCRTPTAPPHPPCAPARPDGSPLWT